MFGLNETGSVDCGKQCSLVWPSVEEGGWPCVEEEGWPSVEEGVVILRELDFDVYAHTKKWRLKSTWKKHVEDESVKVRLRMEDALY